MLTVMQPLMVLAAAFSLRGAPSITTRPYSSLLRVVIFFAFTLSLMHSFGGLVLVKYRWCSGRVRLLRFVTADLDGEESYDLLMNAADLGNEQIPDLEFDQALGW